MLVEGRIFKNKTIFEGNYPNLLVGHHGSRPVRFLHLLVKPGRNSASCWAASSTRVGTEPPKFVFKVKDNKKKQLFASLHLNVAYATKPNLTLESRLIRLTSVLIGPVVFKSPQNRLLKLLQSSDAATNPAVQLPRKVIQHLQR